MQTTANMSSRRVLIVDDEAEVRESVALLLSTAGIETEAYKSAEDFLNSAASGSPVCVILDYRLPGINEIDVLRELADRGSEAAVIMVTGHGDIPTAVAAMKHGAFHFVEKPIDAETLVSTVEEALSRTGQAQDQFALAQAFRARRETLTQREAEVFDLLLEGLPTKVIAHRLEITARTAEHHRAAVMRKLEAKSISHLLKMALNVKYSLTTFPSSAR